LIGILIYIDGFEVRLRAEVLALRYQLRVLVAQTGRPHCRLLSPPGRRPSERLLLAAVSRVLPRPSWRSLLPSPDTLLRWHRELVRRE